MDYVKLYSNIIKRNASYPNKAYKLIKYGLKIGYKYTLRFPDIKVPRALQYLNSICFKFILEPFENPDISCFVNLFAPSEILHAMDLKPILIEALSSFMCGFNCEDFFIQYAENAGISNSLCSYHKTFIGMNEANILPKPKIALTTTTACDANTNTFKYVCSKRNIPYIILDVPYTYSKENINYLEKQIYQCIYEVENITGKKFDIDKLREIIVNENKCVNFMKEYLQSLKTIYYPTTLTLQMYMLLTSHTYMARKETIEFYSMLKDDIKNYNERKGISIYWSHIMPFYHNVLKEYFNLNPNYQLLGYDLCFDYLEEMDYSNPIRSLCEKMILNNYNGPYDRKLNGILKAIDELNPDGVINFCHWGCKQSSGGVYLLKDELKKEIYLCLYLMEMELIKTMHKTDK